MWVNLLHSQKSQVEHIKTGSTLVVAKIVNFHSRIQCIFLSILWLFVTRIFRVHAHLWKSCSDTRENLGNPKRRHNQNEMENRKMKHFTLVKIFLIIHMFDRLASAQHNCCKKYSENNSTRRHAWELDFSRIGKDICANLIHLWAALLQGWVSCTPPFVSIFQTWMCNIPGAQLQDSKARNPQENRTEPQRTVASCAVPGLSRSGNHGVRYSRFTPAGLDWSYS